MVAQVVSAGPAADTLVHFNAWGSAISAGISATGLTKTADTGQVTWAGNSVWPNNVANTKAVYEIWQFTDTLQSTAPVYIRLDYGSGGAVSNPQMWVTIGTATNGAGTITAATQFPNSVHVARGILYPGTSSWFTATAATIYVDSDGGSSLMIAGWNYVGGVPGVAGTLTVIERTRNWDGTPNNEGVFAFVGYAGGGSGSLASYRTLIIANANTFSQPIQVNMCPMLISGSQAFVPPSTGLVGTTVYCVPVFTGWTPRMHGPSKHMIGVYAFDMPANNQFNVTHYGATHTFVNCGGIPGSATWTFTGSWAMDQIAPAHACAAWRIT